MRRLLAIMPFVIMVSPAHAQSNDMEASLNSVTVGVGGAYVPDYEGSDDYRLAVGPAAVGQVGGFAFQVAGNRASVDLIPNRPGPVWDIQAGPIGVLNFNRFSVKSIDDPRIKALGKRATALELGGYVGIGKTGVMTSDYDRLAVSVSYRKGVTGAHSAGILQPTILYATPLSRKALVSLIVSAERAERGYAQAYYTVDAAGSAASGLPQYYARGGWKNYTVAMLGTYSVSGNLLHGWKVIGGGTYRRLLNDFAQSPIVSVAGDRNQWMGVLGVAYTF